jgi:hypothetical protein
LEYRDDGRAQEDGADQEDSPTAATQNPGCQSPQDPVCRDVIAIPETPEFAQSQDVPSKSALGLAMKSYEEDGKQREERCHDGQSLRVAVKVAYCIAETVVEMRA